MTKSIVTGGVMLVALAALVMGLTDVLALSSAGIVSWAAVGAVATILFGAFGGFKPFFSSGMPGDDEGGGGGGNGGDGGNGDGGGGNGDDGSPLEALQGQSQSISRKLVTVGAEDEKDHPLFDDRAPIVSQPNITSPPAFNPDSQKAAAPAQPTHPLFGQALREQLDSDRAAGEDDTGHEKEGAQDTEALENGRIDPDPQGPASSPPIVTDAAPWVAARNAQITEDVGSVPTIEVEESPSWMSTADVQDADAGQIIEAGEDDQTLDSDGVWTEVDPDGAAITEAGDESQPEDDPENQLEEIEVLHDETATDEDTELIAQDIETTEELDVEETADATTGATEDVSEPAGGDLVEAVSQSDQLPVVMKPPSALEIQKYSPSEILTVVRAQEAELVDTLIGEGVLTTSGPITDKDVRTMLFVAVSSNELIDVLTEASGDSPELRTGGTAALPQG